jgi:hypothetical protein
MESLMGNYILDKTLLVDGRVRGGEAAGKRRNAVNPRRVLPKPQQRPQIIMPITPDRDKLVFCPGVSPPDPEMFEQDADFR